MLEVYQPLGPKSLLGEARFVSRLIHVFSIGVVFGQAFPNLDRLLLVVQIAVHLNLADNAEQCDDRSTEMAEFVLMNGPLFDVLAKVFWSDVGQHKSGGRHQTGWL